MASWVPLQPVSQVTEVQLPQATHLSPATPAPGQLDTLEVNKLFRIDSVFSVSSNVYHRSFIEVKFPILSKLSAVQLGSFQSFQQLKSQEVWA